MLCSEARMVGHAEVIIIGGGVIGCGIAYHLAKAGRDVLLLEKGELAAGTTSQAAGLVGQLRSSATMIRLMQLSMGAITSLRRDTGEDPGFRQVGSIRLALTPEREEELHRHVAFGRRHGIDIDFISPAEARRLVPGLETLDATIITHIPSDGYVDPYSLCMAFARGARQRGARLRTGARVLAVTVEAGRIRRVVTEEEEIEAEWVVDAAGAWTALVGEMAGVRVPVFPVRHQLWVTAPLADVQPEMPVVRIPDAYAYVRPEVNGLLVGFFEPEGKAFDIREFPADFDMRGMPQDWGVLTGWAPGLSSYFPPLREAGVVRGCAGLPTFTPDGRLIVSRVPNLERFLIASGCCAHGVMTAGGIGQLVAELIVEGEASIDIGALDVARFGPEYADPERLRRDCEGIYGGYYGLSSGYR